MSTSQSQDAQSEPIAKKSTLAWRLGEAACYGLVAASIYYAWNTSNDRLIPEFIIASFLIAMFNGMVELLGRYRDEPFKTLTSRWGRVYLLFNGLLGFIGYTILTVSAQTGGGTLDQLQLAAAGGLGASVIIRTRLFSVKIGDRDVAIGPAYVVDKFLEVLDSQIDRQRALDRTDLVTRVMAGKDFHVIAPYAKVYIASSLQSLSSEQREQLNVEIDKIKDDVPEQCQSLALGFTILDYVGDRFFKEIFEVNPVFRAEGDVEEALARLELFNDCFEARNITDIRADLSRARQSPDEFDLNPDELSQIQELLSTRKTANLLGYAIIDVLNEQTIRRIFTQD